MSLQKPATTSEEALARYQQAHRDGGVEAVIDMIDFSAEAANELKRAKTQGNLAAASEVLCLAQARETELRDYLSRHGFATGLNVGHCKVVATYENSPEQHTFALQDTPDSRSVNTFSVAFHLTGRGWLLVRSS
jgi:hypothetical protein